MNFFACLLLIIGTHQAFSTTLFISGAGSSKSNFTPYWEDAGVEPLYFQPNINPFTASHARDYKKILELVQGLKKLKIVAFSVGGKFAYKLASDLPEDVLDELILLDPVGGPPPQRKASEKFPIWLKDDVPKHIQSKTTIFRSDKNFAASPILLNFTEHEFGPDRYIKFMKQAQVIQIAGTSHSSFLFPPLLWGTRIACQRGTPAGEKELRARVKNSICPVR